MTQNQRNPGLLSTQLKNALYKFYNSAILVYREGRRVEGVGHEVHVVSYFTLVVLLLSVESNISVIFVFCRIKIDT